jgi:hypothetical protein
MRYSRWFTMICQARTARPPPAIGPRMRLPFVAAALVATAVAAPAATASGAATSPPPNAGRGYASPAAVAAGGPIHGMIISDAGQPFGANLADLPRLVDDGVNTVSFYVTNNFTDARNPKIVSGPKTPTDTQVTAAIAAAHAAGLAVEISPILWSKGKYVWRGAIDPQDINSFWSSFTAMTLRYAKLSQAAGVELFAIGSEYKGLQKYTGRWSNLAAAVRQVYSGRLTYMAGTREIAQVAFWRSVDYIGNSPYYQLSPTMTPTYTQLRAGWSAPLRQVRAVSLKYNRPVLFNEIGYLSAQGSTIRPWSPDAIGPASQRLQANAYAALLDVASKRPWLKGIVFYRWSTNSLPTDKTWSPRDKRAECEMARRWAAPTSTRLPDGLPVGCIGADLAASAGVP